MHLRLFFLQAFPAMLFLEKLITFYARNIKIHLEIHRSSENFHLEYFVENTKI